MSEGSMIPPRRLQSALIADRTSEEDMIDAPEHQVESRLLLDVIVRECATVLELLARKDQALLVGRDAARRVNTPLLIATNKGADAPLLVLDLGLDIVDGVAGLDLESDGLASKSLHEDLHGN